MSHKTMRICKDLIKANSKYELQRKKALEAHDEIRSSYKINSINGLSLDIRLRRIVCTFVP